MNFKVNNRQGLKQLISTINDTLFSFTFSDSAIKRKIDEGLESVANTLKLIGFFEQDDAEF